MNCPVCDRLLAPTLSICPACGTMMNDTVREELQSKITMGPPSRIAVRTKGDTATTPTPRSRPVERIVTAGLVAPKTSPTLVEFQNKQPALPDWRLQMQNAVRQRRSIQEPPAQPTPAATAVAVAVQPEVEKTINDPRVNKALDRIQASRAKFTEARPPAGSRKPQVTPAAPMPRPAAKLGVVSAGAAAAPAPSRIQPVQRPKLVVPAQPTKRVTNQLPPIESVEQLPVEKSAENKVEVPIVPFEAAEIDRIRIHVSQDTAVDTASDNVSDDIEDLAPFSMRFGAGLFDLIIGAFIAMVAMSPFILAGGDWSTTGGILLFAGVWTVVLFLYMTACLGFVGKTIGMRLFSLELVDAFENEYPTLHQAAINSAVYLVTLPLVGAGFLTILYNEENRALHDLLSGTIQVKEF